MKKLIATVAVIFLVLITVVLYGIDSYSKATKLPTVNNKVTQDATSRLVSKTGLDEWTITMTPRLGTTIQYNGNTTIQDVSIKLSTGITLDVPTVHPKSPIELKDKETAYLGKVTANLEWVDKGQKHYGDVIFQIDALK